MNSPVAEEHARAASVMVLRPDRTKQVGAWAFTAFGVIFGLSAVAGGDLLAEILMGLFGLLCVLSGPGAAITRLTCDPSGLRYRTLWRTTRVSASDVTAVTTRSVPGYGRKRIRIDIERQSGDALKLTALQRQETPTNLLKSEADADAIRHALGEPTGALLSNSGQTPALGLLGILCCRRMSGERLFGLARSEGPF